LAAICWHDQHNVFQFLQLQEIRSQEKGNERCTANHTRMHTTVLVLNTKTQVLQTTPCEAIL